MYLTLIILPLLGSIISVVAILLLLNIVYFELALGRTLSRNPWDTSQFYKDVLHNLLSSIKSCLNSPPRPHIFTVVGLKSVLPLNECYERVSTLVSQVDDINIAFITAFLAYVTNYIVALYNGPNMSNVTYDQVIPFIIPMVNGLLTPEQIKGIVSYYMLQNGAGVVMDATNGADMQFLARVGFSYLMMNEPKGIKFASLYSLRGTGELGIEAKWLENALGQIGSEEANRILNILTSFRKRSV